jgi:hypothetical protein
LCDTAYRLQCSLSVIAWTHWALGFLLKDNANPHMQRMKRKIRRLRIIQRSLTLITSALVLGFMINTYVDFVRHRTIQSGGQTVAIYPTDPITWPTFMMIATGAVSTLFSGAVVIAYFWGVAASNRVSMWSNYWSYLMHVVNLCVWLATSTTLQMLQGAADAVPPPRDLYGWTCSNKADDLVGQYGNQIPVDFNFQCETQVRFPIPQCIQEDCPLLFANTENRLLASPWVSLMQLWRCFPSPLASMP